MREMRFLRKLFAREGPSLAAVLLIMSLLTVVVGIGLGNWMIRILAGPQTQETEVAHRQQQEQHQETLPEDEITRPDEPAPPVEELPEDEEEVVVSREEEFMVQAGVFNSRDNAQRLKTLLEEEGFQVWITDSQPYRVHLGLFSDRRDAEEIRDEAERKGFEVFIAH